MWGGGLFSVYSCIEIFSGFVIVFLKFGTSVALFVFTIKIFDLYCDAVYFSRGGGGFQVIFRQLYFCFHFFFPNLFHENF